MLTDTLPDEAKLRREWVNAFCLCRRLYSDADRNILLAAFKQMRLLVPPAAVYKEDGMWAVDAYRLEADAYQRTGLFDSEQQAWEHVVYLTQCL